MLILVDIRYYSDARLKISLITPDLLYRIVLSYAIGPRQAVPTPLGLTCLLYLHRTSRSHRYHRRDHAFYASSRYDSTCRTTRWPLLGTTPPRKTTTSYRRYISRRLYRKGPNAGRHNRPYTEPFYLGRRSG